MEKTKLLKSILIPTLGISAIGTIAAVSTSCGEVHVSSVTLDKTSTTLAVDNNETLTATVLPENATDKTVTWGSSDTSVAAVDANGTITAVAEGTATITVKTNDGNKTATCEVNVIDLSGYIGITANADSTLTLDNSGGNNPNLQYSTEGKSWSTYSSELNINQGQTLYLKGNNPTGWSTSNTNYSCLSFTGNVSISGNIMALLDNGANSGEEGDITDIPCNYCFYDLFFESTGITSISKNFLPATNLTSYCYDGMFYQCTSLTTAPELPATTLKDSCYYGMFENCTSLTNAPELPATTLTPRCYASMFYKCSSLTTAPELPATNLARDCYAWMFSSCSALTNAPELPATTLTPSCYQCMYKNCISLKSIKIGYTGNYDYTYFDYWVNDVASSGTFYYNGITQTAQDFQLPSGWTTSRF